MLRTTNPRIYVVGDVAGGYQFTHVAEHHAGIVLRQAIFQLQMGEAVARRAVVHVHRSRARARRRCPRPKRSKQGLAHRVYRFPFDEIDRARAEGETEGFAKLVTDPRGKLLGAAIVGAARRRADRRVRAGDDARA